MADTSRFLEGVHRHLADFAASAGVEPGEVFLRITLADGTVVSTHGLNVSTTYGANAWGQIEGVGDDLLDSLVIRESGVLKVQLQLASPVTPPIGFSTEAGEAV